MKNNTIIISQSPEKRRSQRSLRRQVVDITPAKGKRRNEQGRHHSHTFHELWVDGVWMRRPEDINIEPRPLAKASPLQEEA